MADYPKSEVVLTEKIRRWIRTVLTTSSLPNETRDELRKYTANRRNSDEQRRRTIPFELVKTVHKYLQSEQGGLYLHELLEGSDVELPQLPVIQRDPAYEETLQRLRAQQANIQYAAMTHNIDSQRIKEPSTMGQEIRSVNQKLIAMFNFVLTVIGSFVFAYKATEYSLQKPSFELQLCSGLVVATIVFMADVYFLIKNTI
ncbi:transmembrane protein 199 [Lamellibrachia satsuma]|nr:transmembrane protein 199 [Lamellibrachia satsuma]